MNKFEEKKSTTFSDLWEEIKKKIKEEKYRDSTHYFFVELQKDVFQQLGLDLLVESNVAVTKRPPRVDMLYSYPGGLTPEQRKRLPDGIAQSDADDILAELKNTQGVNEESMTQSLIYHELQKKKVKSQPGRKVETFLISASTPNDKTLKEFGYEKVTGLSGVYRTSKPPWRPITLILINELEETPNNALAMLFATRKEKRLKALDILWDSELYPQTDYFKFTSKVGCFFVVDLVF